MLRDAVPPSALCKLLLTACVRQHADAAELVLGELLVRSSTTIAASLAHLLSMPAADKLSSGIIKQLMQEAVQQGSMQLLGSLCQLPAAQKLDGAAVAKLLQHPTAVGTLYWPATHADSSCIMQLLCSLKGAQQLPNDDMQQLLYTTAKHGMHESTEQL